MQPAALHVHAVRSINDGPPVLQIRPLNKVLASPTETGGGNGNRPQDVPAQRGLDGLYVGGVAALLGIAPQTTYGQVVKEAAALLDAAGAPEAARRYLFHEIGPIPALARSVTVALSHVRDPSRDRLHAFAPRSKHPLAAWTTGQTWVLRLAATLLIADGMAAVRPCTRQRLHAAVTYRDGFICLDDTTLAREVADADLLCTLCVLDSIRALALDRLCGIAIARAIGAGRLHPEDVLVSDRELWRQLWDIAEEATDVELLLQLVDRRHRFAVGEQGYVSFCVTRTLGPMNPLVLGADGPARLTAVDRDYRELQLAADSAAGSQIKVSLLADANDIDDG